MAKRAMLCPRCRRIIGSDETVCSWCGASRANPWWRAISWSRGSLGEEWLVQVILVTNVVLFIASLLLTRRHSLTFNPLGFLSPDDMSLMLLGATGTVPIELYGRFWTLLSANYLHGGLLHIGFNMMAFRQISTWTSREYGDSRMFAIYTLGGIASYAVSYLAGIPFTIGASGAICALIGSLLYYGRSRGGVYGAMVFREVGGWVIGLFIFGLVVPGINNWAHGGGLVAGYLLGMLLGYDERKRENSIHRLLAVGCGVATVVVLIYAAVGAVRFRFHI